MKIVCVPCTVKLMKEQLFHRVNAEEQLNWMCAGCGQLIIVELDEE